MIGMLMLAALTGVDAAVAYLTVEVPRWARENHCYSCHNNGDAARALYAANKWKPLADTTKWVSHPDKWDSNRGNPAFSDKKLARIQFAASLLAAVEAGAVKDRKALRDAAESLLPDQEADGSWQVDAGAAIGSPATYGPFLATYMARRTLERSGSSKAAEAVARADAWMRRASPTTTLDTAARVLALQDRGEDWRASLDVLMRNRNRGSAWGPYRNSPSEPFDTAVAMLALNAVQDRVPEARAAIASGRDWLLKEQLSTGGWVATTRPAGSQSYAQHISTTGWVTLALLATSR